MFHINIFSNPPKKEYTFPGTDLTIPEGTEVHIPIMAFHFDEEIFPHPHKFDPERFTPEATAGRHPMAYMPFGQAVHDVCPSLGAD